MDFKLGGSALREIRIERGFTQEALGEMVGVSAVTVSRIERGVFTPSLSTFISFCNALEIGADCVLADYIHAAFPVRWTSLGQKLEELDDDRRARAEVIIKSVLDNI